jgi:hypothetical protein
MLFWYVFSEDNLAKKDVVAVPRGR